MKITRPEDVPDDPIVLIDLENINIEDDPNYHIDTIKIEDDGIYYIDGIKIEEDSEIDIETIKIEEDSEINSETIKIEDDSENKIETIKIEDDSEINIETIKIEDDSEINIETIKIEDDPEINIETIKIEDDLDSHIDTIKIEDDLDPCGSGAHNASEQLKDHDGNIIKNITAKKGIYVLPITFFDNYQNVRLLSKCRPLSIKLINCLKIPNLKKYFEKNKTTSIDVPIDLNEMKKELQRIKKEPENLENPELILSVAGALYEIANSLGGHQGMRDDNKKGQKSTLNDENYSNFYPKNKLKTYKTIFDLTDETDIKETETISIENTSLLVQAKYPNKTVLGNKNQNSILTKEIAADTITNNKFNNIYAVSSTTQEQDKTQKENTSVLGENKTKDNKSRNADIQLKIQNNIIALSVNSNLNDKSVNTERQNERVVLFGGRNECTIEDAYGNIPKKDFTKISKDHEIGSHNLKSLLTASVNINNVANNGTDKIQSVYEPINPLIENNRHYDNINNTKLVNDQQHNMHKHTSPVSDVPEHLSINCIDPIRSIHNMCKESSLMCSTNIDPAYHNQNFYSACYHPNYRIPDRTVIAPTQMTPSCALHEYHNSDLVNEITSQSFGYMPNNNMYLGYNNPSEFRTSTPQTASNVRPSLNTNNYNQTLVRNAVCSARSLPPTYNQTLSNVRPNFKSNPATNICNPLMARNIGPSAVLPAHYHSNTNAATNKIKNANAATKKCNTVMTRNFVPTAVPPPHYQTVSNVGPNINIYPATNNCNTPITRNIVSSALPPTHYQTVSNVCPNMNTYPAINNYNTSIKRNVSPALPPAYYQTISNVSQNINTNSSVNNSTSLLARQLACSKPPPLCNPSTRNHIQTWFPPPHYHVTNSLQNNVSATNVTQSVPHYINSMLKNNDAINGITSVSNNLNPPSNKRASNVKSNIKSKFGLNVTPSIPHKQKMNLAPTNNNDAAFNVSPNYMNLPNNDVRTQHRLHCPHILLNNTAAPTTLKVSQQSAQQYVNTSSVNGTALRANECDNTFSKNNATSNVRASSQQYVNTTSDNVIVNLRTSPQQYVDLPSKQGLTNKVGPPNRGVSILSNINLTAEKEKYNQLQMSFFNNISTESQDINVTSADATLNDSSVVSTNVTSSIANTNIKGDTTKPLNQQQNNIKLNNVALTTEISCTNLPDSCVSTEKETAIALLTNITKLRKENDKNCSKRYMPFSSEVLDLIDKKPTNRKQMINKNKNTTAIKSTEIPFQIKNLQYGIRSHFKFVKKAKNNNSSNEEQTHQVTEKKEDKNNSSNEEQTHQVIENKNDTTSAKHESTSKVISQFVNEIQENPLNEEHLKRKTNEFPLEVKKSLEIKSNSVLVKEVENHKSNKEQTCQINEINSNSPKNDLTSNVKNTLKEPIVSEFVNEIPKHPLNGAGNNQSSQNKNNIVSSTNDITFKVKTTLKEPIVSEFVNEIPQQLLNGAANNQSSENNNNTVSPKNDTTSKVKNTFNDSPIESDFVKEINKLPLNEAENEKCNENNNNSVSAKSDITSIVKKTLKDLPIESDFGNEMNQHPLNEAEYKKSNENNNNTANPKSDITSTVKKTLSDFVNNINKIPLNETDNIISSESNNNTESPKNDTTSKVKKTLKNTPIVSNFGNEMKQHPLNEADYKETNKNNNNTVNNTLIHSPIGSDFVNDKNKLPLSETENKRSKEKNNNTLSPKNDTTSKVTKTFKNEFVSVNEINKRPWNEGENKKRNENNNYTTSPKHGITSKVKKTLKDLSIDFEFINKIEKPKPLLKQKQMTENTRIIGNKRTAQDTKDNVPTKCIRLEVDNCSTLLCNKSEHKGRIEKEPSLQVSNNSNLEKSTCNVYSPPILPIPTYAEALNIVNKAASMQKENDLLKNNQTSSNNNEEKGEACRMQNISTPKQIPIQSTPVKRKATSVKKLCSRRISLDEYKKRKGNKVVDLKYLTSSESDSCNEELKKIKTKIHNKITGEARSCSPQHQKYNTRSSESSDCSHDSDCTIIL